MSRKSIRVLVVEDVDAMRAALAVFLKTLPRIEVSGLASNVWEARMELTKSRPDLVFLDEILPGESSLDLLGELNREGIPVVLLTSMENPPPDLPAGVRGRLVKPGWQAFEADRQRFIQKINEVFP